MEVLQKFSIKLDNYPEYVHITFYRNPNLTGGIRDMWYWDVCYHDMRMDQVFIEHEFLDNKTKKMIYAKAAELWDSYWTPDCTAESELEYAFRWIDNESNS